MRNYLSHREKYGKQKDLWKICSAKEYYFKVDEKQRESLKLHQTSSSTKNTYLYLQRSRQDGDDWVTLQRSQQKPIDGALITDTFLCKSLKFPDFKAPDGWIEKSKKRSEKLNIISLLKPSLKHFSLHGYFYYLVSQKKVGLNFCQPKFSSPLEDFVT